MAFINVPPPINPTKAEIVEELRIEFGDRLTPYMFAIMDCESDLMQWRKDGSVVKSETLDFGIGQINEPTWDKRAKELGIDYKNDWRENIRMMKVVYEESKRGLLNWTCRKALDGYQHPTLATDSQ